MLVFERQKIITERIQRDKTVKVSTLSKEFGVTEETIRRDLEALEKIGLLKRTYGGAVFFNLELNEREDTPFTARMNQNIEGKGRIAELLTIKLTKRQVLMLDSSTTCLEIAKNLPKNLSLTVITNSVSIITSLSQYEKITIISSGGTLRSASLSFIGATAASAMKNYYADTAVISCKGMDMERGITESSEQEAEIKQTMMASAREVILAVDYRKVDRISVYKITDIEKVGTIITDRKPREEWIEYCAGKGIELLYPSESI